MESNSTNDVIVSSKITYKESLFSTLFVLTGLLVISTNGFSLMIIRRQNNVFGDVSRFLYRNIAVIDLFGGVSGCVFYSILRLHRIWPFDEWSCRILSTLFYVSLMESAVILTYISIERYIAISKPLRYESIVTLSRMKIMICILLIPACVCIVMGMIPGTSPYKLVSPICSKSLMGHDLIQSDVTVMYILYSFAITPINIGMALNFHSMVISIRQTRAIAALHPAGAREHNRSRVDFKGVKTILIISAVNAVAWAPSIIRLQFLLTPSSEISEEVDVAFSLLTLINFWSNAFIFARTNRAYRQAATALFRSAFCQGRPYPIE